MSNDNEYFDGTAPVDHRTTAWSGAHPVYAQDKADIARALALGVSAEELELTAEQVEQIAAWLASEGIGKRE